jgi:uncharacterized protein (TIGR03435 family)
MRRWVVLVVVCFACLRCGGQQGVASDQTLLKFEVAAVKLSDPAAPVWKVQFTETGFSAMNVSLRKIIEEAFGVYEANRLEVQAAWVNTVKFDIEARVAQEDLERYTKVHYEDRRPMLQALLAERFGLAIRHVDKDLPVYFMVVAKGGSKLKDVPSERLEEMLSKGSPSHVTKSRFGVLAGEDFSSEKLAGLLTMVAGRRVVDRTGLKGRYDFALHWAGDAKHEAEEPDLFTAIREQLGLGLEAGKDATDCLVVERVERPSEN